MLSKGTKKKSLFPKDPGKDRAGLPTVPMNIVTVPFLMTTFPVWQSGRMRAPGTCIVKLSYQWQLPYFYPHTFLWRLLTFSDNGKSHPSVWTLSWQYMVGFWCILKSMRIIHWFLSKWTIGEINYMLVVSWPYASRSLLENSQYIWWLDECYLKILQNSISTFEFGTNGLYQTKNTFTFRNVFVWENVSILLLWIFSSLRS